MDIPPEVQAATACTAGIGTVSSSSTMCTSAFEEPKDRQPEAIRTKMINFRTCMGAHESDLETAPGILLPSLASSSRTRHPRSASLHLHASVRRGSCSPSHAAEERRGQAERHAGVEARRGAQPGRLDGHAPDQLPQDRPRTSCTVVGSPKRPVVGARADAPFHGRVGCSRRGSGQRSGTGKTSMW